MAPSTPHRPPPTIPGFEYLEVLGTGGFSDVYLYQQKLPRRRVAIKVLHVDALNRQLRRQFVAEANLMAQLSSHPAIATIYAADISGEEHPYLVMEFCSGGSLGSVYRAKPLTAPEVLNIGIRVASALESAHRAGIVHRDVKPANILLTDYGSPVLTDFGISIGDDGVNESTMFRGDVTVTTGGNDSTTLSLSVPWAPPEAFDDVPVSNERSDVYSLGATLFSLLEGRTPFEIAGASNGAVQLSRRIERGELNAPTRDNVPESLRAAIARAMEVRPANRFASALEFATALQAVQRELGIGETPIEIGREPHRMDVAAEPEAAETVIRPAALTPTPAPLASEDTDVRHPGSPVPVQGPPEAPTQPPAAETPATTPAPTPVSDATDADAAATNADAADTEATRLRQTPLPPLTFAAPAPAASAPATAAAAPPAPPTPPVTSATPAAYATPASPTAPKKSRRLPILIGAAALAVVIAGTSIVIANLPNNDNPAVANGGSGENTDTGTYSLCDTTTLAGVAAPIDVEVGDFTAVDKALLDAAVAPSDGLLCAYSVQNGITGSESQGFYYDGTGSTFETVQAALPDGYTCGELTVVQDLEGNDVNLLKCTNRNLHVRLYKFINSTPTDVMGEASYVVVEIDAPEN